MVFQFVCFKIEQDQNACYTPHRCESDWDINEKHEVVAKVDEQKKEEEESENTVKIKIDNEKSEKEEEKENVDQEKEKEEEEEDYRRYIDRE